DQLRPRGDAGRPVRGLRHDRLVPAHRTPGRAARDRQRRPIPGLRRVLVRHRIRDRRRRGDDREIAGGTRSMPSEHHAKHPRREELEGMVRSGAIATLVVAITDMQGRLVGKRVQAQAFLAGVISHGAHFCTYLLGTDMEMNTPDGFTLMNWETGYGDWIAEPV